MTNQNSREILYFKLPVFVVDLGIHLLTLGCLLRLLPFADISHLFVEDGPKTLYGLLAVSFVVSISIFDLKIHERRIRISLVVWRALMQTVVTYILFTALIAIGFKNTPRLLLAYEVVIVVPLIAGFHFVANKLVRLLRHAGHNVRTVVFVGVDDTSLMLYKELLYGRSFSGYKVEGFFSSREDIVIPEGSQLLGSISDFYDWIETHHPDEIYCSLPPAQCEKDVNRIIKICNDRFMEFYFVPTFDGYPKRQLAVRSIGKVNFIKLREEPMNSPFAKLQKRTFDVLVSGLFLCTLYPLVVLFVWVGNMAFGNRGPLYFRQARTGYNGKRFYIYKFRSMKENADADRLQATKDDPRKTPFGDFLRRSSIDELPQFINVFLGDMSIIGPRPHMEYHTEMYSSLIGDYMVRHLAKPGITGWAQVNGCRGETKTVEEMAARVEHDIWYIENWSALLDLTIFFRTFWQVLPGHDKQAY